MKKLITICLLAMTLIAGGMTMDAKTTKKKTKARTSQTIPPSKTKEIQTLLDQYAEAIADMRANDYGFSEEVNRLHDKLKPLQKFMTPKQKKLFKELTTGEYRKKIM